MMFHGNRLSNIMPYLFVFFKKTAKFENALQIIGGAICNKMRKYGCSG